MPAIYHEGSWLGNATDPEVLVKDTVGWTGKNLLKYTATSQTINGVTFTVNADKSITVNGTATNNTIFDLFSLTKEQYYNMFGNRDLILSGCPSGGDPSGHSIDWSKYHLGIIETQNTTNTALTDGGESVTIPASWFASATHNINLRIRISSGQTVSNLTFYPMIRDASITDPTYEPYHESVEVMYEEEIHGVNLLKNEATTQTINGVTFTVNADKSVTVNGTATGGYAQLQIRNRNNNPYNLPIGSYIGNGCPTNGSASTYQMRYIETIDGQAVEHRDYGEGVKFDVTKVNNMGATIYISNGATVNNLVFKPMIRKADIEDSTYRPYNEQAIQNQLNAQGVLGAKNLLPQVEHANTTMTINGVTITNQEDGSVLLNGTSTAAVAYHFIRLSSDANRKFIKQVAGKKVIISGTNVSNTDAKVQFWSATTNVIADTTGKGTTFTIPSDLATTGDYNFAIYIPSGVTLNNIIVYPMLRLASDPDDTYQPYAMTNRELTDAASGKNLTISTTNNSITLGAETYCKIFGSIIIGSLQFTTSAEIAQYNTIASIAYGAVPVNKGKFMFAAISTSQDVYRVTVEAGNTSNMGIWVNGAIPAGKTCKFTFVLFV